ncbi:MAG: hypothetical protein KKG47_03115 [Proteobacteria bacterium]|nr:hypothetical protein [Pseudomonadota bacterium]MBU1738884.1 hypothetical protein [Pseudomonadota bacterium]
MEQIPAVTRLVRKYDLPDDATEEQILRAVMEKGEERLSREAGKLLRMIIGTGVEVRPDPG